MLYEIINPSDPYTIEADSLDVALAACLFLGDGQYAFEPLTDGPRIPLFLFGGVETWCQGHFNQSLEATLNHVLKEKCTELADCMDSCLIGKASDRATYLNALELIDDPSKREQWRAKWHEDRRSSLNDIGSRAFKMAQNFRAESKNPLAPAPQQVFLS